MKEIERAQQNPESLLLLLSSADTETSEILTLKYLFCKIKTFQKQRHDNLFIAGARKWCQGFAKHLGCKHNTGCTNISEESLPKPGQAALYGFRDN